MPLFPPKLQSELADQTTVAAPNDVTDADESHLRAILAAVVQRDDVENSSADPGSLKLVPTPSLFELDSAEDASPTDSTFGVPYPPVFEFATAPICADLCCLLANSSHSTWAGYTHISHLSMVPCTHSTAYPSRLLSWTMG